MIRVFLSTLALLWLISSADAAARFWVGGTGTWDATTTHWAASSGGAGGQTVPGSADDVTFDGSSGGGTVTVNATISIKSLTMGAFTGTLDFATNNNNVTLAANGVGVNISGTGTRTLNMGNGTWTLNTDGSFGDPWTATTTTNLTFNKNGSTIVVGGTSADQRGFIGGGLSYNIVSFTNGTAAIPTQIRGGATFATMNITAPIWLEIGGGTTLTVTNAFTWTGTSSNPIELTSDSVHGTTATLTTGSATTNTGAWMWLQNIVFTAVGGSTFTANNSLNGGGNSGTGFTINAPSGGGGGGGGGRIIGG